MRNRPHIGPGTHVAGICPCPWHGPMIWACTHGAKVFITEAKKNILGLNQVLVGAPDDSKGRSAYFSAADLMGPFSESRNPHFFVLLRRLDPI